MDTCKAWKVIDPILRAAEAKYPHLVISKMDGWWVAAESQALLESRHVINGSCYASLSCLLDNLEGPRLPMADITSRIPPIRDGLVGHLAIARRDLAETKVALERAREDVTRYSEALGFRDEHLRLILDEVRNMKDSYERAVELLKPTARRYP